MKVMNFKRIKFYSDLLNVILNLNKIKLYFILKSELNIVYFSNGYIKSSNILNNSTDYIKKELNAITGYNWRFKIDNNVIGVCYKEKIKNDYKKEVNIIKNSFFVKNIIKKFPELEIKSIIRINTNNKSKCYKVYEGINSINKKKLL